MTSPYQKYKLTTRSKIQNAVDYTVKAPSSSKSRTTTAPRSPSPKPQTSQNSFTNLPLLNRFTNLANFPPLPTRLPTYTQTATASTIKSPTSLNESPSNSPSQTNLTKPFLSPQSVESLQVFKSPEVNIFPIEQQITNIHNSRQVVSHMFPPGWCFQPEHPHKTQTFYKFILVDTSSVLLTHNKCRWDSSRTSFSKCVIKNVISPLQWDVGPPWAPKYLVKLFNLNIIIIMIIKLLGIMPFIFKMINFNIHGFSFLTNI